MGLLALLFAFAFFMGAIGLGGQRVKEVKNRIAAYLCFKEQIVLTRRYIGKIGKTNIAIQAAFAVSLLPGGQTALEAISLLKTAQTVLHFSHVRKLMSSKHCSTKQKLYSLQNTPYQLRQAVVFKRKISGVTTIRRKRWSTFLKREKILLRADWTMQNSLDRDSIPRTRELGLP